MPPVNSQYAAILALWTAVAAIGYLVCRELGTVRLKRHPFAVLVLACALGSIPAGAGLKLARPYGKRLASIVARRQSPALPLSTSCAIFPADNIWNTPISDAQLDRHSDAYVASIGRDVPLHADFGPAAGIPYIVAPEGTPPAFVTFTGARTESDPGPYFVPDAAPIEEASDGHVIVVDPQGCLLYELFGGEKAGRGRWKARSGAVFDLSSNRLRPSGWTSADAAGLPIFPGLVRYDEAASGAIRHAFRFSARQTRRAFIWPARHRASDHDDESLPPMGQRFRLRRSFDDSGFTPEARAIVTALKTYGIMLADNGSSWFVTGAPDSRWTSRIRAELARIFGRDFEAVDVSGWQVDADSGQARRR